MHRGLNKLLILFAAGSMAACNLAVPEPERLTCEHMTQDPVIDNIRPRLGWAVAGGRKNYESYTYRIGVGSDSLATARGIYDMWDYRVLNPDIFMVTYSGEELMPLTTYYWRVECITDEGKTRLSQVASFETGMVSDDNWVGRWITNPMPADYDHERSPEYRKEFFLMAPPLSARLYISADSPYHIRINGESAANSMELPRSVMARGDSYRVYNVTELIADEFTTIEIIAGPTWDDQIASASGIRRSSSLRKRPRLLVDLRMELSDGTTEIISSDTTWRVKASDYKFLTDCSGFVLSPFAGTDYGQWAPPILAPAPYGQLTVLNSIFPPQTSTAHIVNSHKSDSLSTFYLSEITGGAGNFEIYGSPGDTVRIWHENSYTGHRSSGDVLALTDDAISYEPLFVARQYDKIHISGNGQAAITEKGTITGQYWNWDNPIGTAMASDSLPQTILELYHKSLSRQLNSVRINGYSWGTPWSEWLSDCAYQLDFFISRTIMEADRQTNFELTNRFFEFWGDPLPLKLNYPNLRNMIEEQTARAGAGLVNNRSRDFEKYYTPTLAGPTLHYFGNIESIRRSAIFLDRSEEAAAFLSLSNKVANTINSTLLNRSSYQYGNGTVQEQTAALYYGLVPEDIKGPLLDNLKELLYKDFDPTKLTPRELKILLSVLTQSSMADKSLEIAGSIAREIGDRMDFTVADHNYILALTDWLFEGLAGIAIKDSEPGLRDLVVRTRFPEGMNWFESSHAGPYGKVRIRWDRKGESIRYVVTIPPACTARILLPSAKDGTLREYVRGSGEYDFSF